MRELIQKVEKNKFIPYIVLGLSVVMISLGLMRKEHLVVLKKAINICLECIGIG